MSVRTLLLALCLSLAAFDPALTQGVKSDQEVLIDLERQWDAAFHRQDA